MKENGKNNKKSNLTFGLVKSFMKNHKTLVIVYIILITLLIPVEVFLFPKQISSLMELFGKGGIKSLDVFTPIVLCLFLVMFLTLMKRSMENTIIPKFSIFTRKWIFEYIIKENQARHEELSIGKIMSILSELPSSARSAVIVFLRNLFPYLIGFVFLSIYFFSFDKSIGYLQLTTLILWILVYTLRSRRCLRIFEVAQDDVINLYENVQDKLSNLISIYSSQTEIEEIKNHNAEENLNEKKYSSSLNCILKTELISNIIILVSFIIFNYLILKSYQKKKLSMKAISSLYIIEIYYWIIILRRVESNIGEFIHSVGNVRSIDKFFDAMRDRSNSMNEGSTKFNTHLKKNNNLVIKFENVSFKYDKTNNMILKNLSFSLFRDDIVWIKGHSGSGKSTIFKLVMGYLKPTQGNVYLLDKNIEKTNVNDIRDIITYVEQDIKLFDSDVYSNIVYGNENNSRKQIMEILNTIDIKIFDKLPYGLGTKVGILGSNLSGGQKQTILLLRAYLRKNTQIILLDEPLSAIDFESVPEVLKLIKFMSKNKTLLVISHNDEISKIVTKTVDLNSENI